LPPLDTSPAGGAGKDPKLPERYKSHPRSGVGDADRGGECAGCAEATQRADADPACRFAQPCNAGKERDEFKAQPPSETADAVDDIAVIGAKATVPCCGDSIDDAPEIVDTLDAITSAEETELHAVDWNEPFGESVPVRRTCWGDTLEHIVGERVLFPGGVRQRWCNTHLSASV